MRVTGILVVAVLLCPAGALGDAETDLERASRLRKEADADWKDGRYTEAATKLAEAASIYEKAEGDHLADWAIAMRALTWNRMKAGDSAAAVEAFARLARRASGVDELSGDVRSAYSAIWHAADESESIEAMIAIFDQARRVLIEERYEKFAAQALHDLGYLSNQRGAVQRSIAYYRQAIQEREEIRDRLGRAWSCNNLASVLMDGGKMPEAREPLFQAYAAVHAEGIVEPHPSVAFNVRRMMNAIRVAGDPEGWGRAWLHTLIGTGGRSRLPHIVSLPYMQRVALELVAGEADGVIEAKRAETMKINEVPGAIMADLKIRAALRAESFGQSEVARRWLGRVEVGQGPVAPHLQARLVTARAIVELGAGETEKFLALGDEACKLWNELGDRGGETASATAMAEAIRRAKAGDKAGKFLLRLEEIARRGKPGGTGGSASSGGDLSGYGKLKPHDTLFTIAFRRNQIVISDHVAGRKQEFDLTWRPRNVSFNGIGLTLHGAYVQIRSVHYGGSAAAPGAPGTLTLDEMGDYRPVPGSGTLCVLKNGSVIYR